jgi:trigger factor
MKVAIDEPTKWERILTVEVPAEDLSGDLDDVYRELGDRVTLPGFRPGKAPRHVIRARFGHSIQHEILERVIPRVYREALEQEKLVPVSDPEFESVDYAENAPLSFKARVRVAPRIEPKGYRGMQLKLVVEPAKDSEIQGNLDAIRDQNADYVVVEREAAEGDFAIVDYAALDSQGKPSDKWSRGFPIPVGEGGLVPEFGRALRGAPVGAERDVAVERRDREHPDRPPESTTFRLVVREIREKRLPALDDELARRVETKVGGETVRFESLEALKEEVTKRLGLVEETRARERMAEEAMARLLEENRFEAPDFLVDQLLEGIEARAEDADPRVIGDREAKTRELRTRLRPEAERRVRRSLLLAAIGRAEGIRVTAEEVDREIARIARREDRDPRDVREALQKADALGGMRERLHEEKVLRFVLEKAEVKREEGGASRLIVG